MNYKTEGQFKEEIEVICRNLFKVGMSCIEFQVSLKVVEHWIQCEWLVGHIDIFGYFDYKTYVEQIAFKYWQI